jgi:SAM-dependent methyltransferase
MFAEANRRAPASVAALEFRSGDVRKLNFPQSSFDRERTDRVPMYVHEIEQAPSEILHVLRPGGWLTYTQTVCFATTAWRSERSEQRSRTKSDAFLSQLDHPRNVEPVLCTPGEGVTSRDIAVSGLLVPPVSPVRQRFSRSYEARGQTTSRARWAYVSLLKTWSDPNSFANLHCLS